MGLVRYPTTVAPERGSVVVEAVCADNAHSISWGMSVECDYNGVWQEILHYLFPQPITPECQCDEGYHQASGDDRMICQGEKVLCFMI